MRDAVIEFKSKALGPISMVMVGVHGNERCGVNLLDSIIPVLKITRGTVLMCYGNPSAMRRNRRYIDSDLDRVFVDSSFLSSLDMSGHEYQRAAILKSYLERVEVLLDIHSSFVTDDEPFLICERNSSDISSFLPIEKVVFGSNLTRNGGAVYYMNKIGKIGMRLECGGEDNPESFIRAKRCLLSFLRVRGHITGETSLSQQKFYQVKEVYISNAEKFYLERPFVNFEYLLRGQSIGIDDGRQVFAGCDGNIIFARSLCEKYEEAFAFAVGLL